MTTMKNSIHDNANGLDYTLVNDHYLDRSSPDRCRIVRLSDLREGKKRPHLVENQISKSLKERFK